MNPKNNLKLILISITFFGFFLSSVVSWFLYEAKMNELYLDYRKEVGEYREAIYTDAALRLEVLYALSILYHEDSTTDFKRMDAEVEKLLKRHKEIHALAWVPRIKSSQRVEFISRQQLEFPEFEILKKNAQKNLVKEDIRKEYFPIYHLSPLKENKNLFGLNLSSNPLILKTLEKAMQSGQAQATDSIAFFQHNKTKKGFFIFLPVYTSNSVTQEDRVKNLKGFVTGVYTYDEVFSGSKLEDELDGVEIKILDATSSTNELLQTHNPHPSSTLNKDLVYTRYLHETLGRKLVMTSIPTYDFINSQRGFLYIIVFSAGVFLTLSIVIYILIISRRKKLKHELEGRINEEVYKNQEKTDQLIQQSKLAQMGEMISMIAHQWRQPLTAISATANVITFQIELEGKISMEELKNEVALISEYSQHLSSTIDDFRNFYKPNKTKEFVTFEEILDKTINIIHSTYENNKIELVKNYKCLEKLHIYPSQLSQVILNILKNAEDVLVDKNIKNPRVVINTYLDDDNFVLEINDNAGGVKTEHLDEIFNPYFSTKTKKDGTGLGLYMSKTIIEEHCDGKLSIENNDSGALFTIRIKKQ